MWPLAGPDNGERGADTGRHRLGHTQHGPRGERLAGYDHALRSGGRRPTVREAEYQSDAAAQLSAATTGASHVCPA
jgi:hypothetical protein